VVALDVPSGVDADTGQVPGDAVRAALTVAFGWPKLGTLLHPARAHTGRLVAVEIGFPPPAAGRWPAWLLTPGWAAPRRPRRDPDTHKKRVGSLLLVAGSPGMAGAAVLAARAALRAGVGYVRLASHADNRELLQEAVPDAPFLDAADVGALVAALEASEAVAVGPGLGTDAWAGAALDAVLRAAPSADDGRDGQGRNRVPLVLDADALNLLAATPDRLGHAAEDGGRAVVLTPHPGEMARLLATDAADVQADRPAAARALADRTGATVVLKGAPTLVAEPGGRLAVSGVGGSELAVAGMGDVLTGAIAGLLAQGLSPVDATGLALVATARAAARRGAGPGLVASDVPDQLSAALAELGPGHSELDEPWVTLDLDPAR
jgi:NAD(P)H-hydrate epimerase